MSVEFVIIAPLLLTLLALIYGYGRVAQVNGTLEAGTRDAARAATQARSGAEATQVAEQVIRDSMAASPDCLGSLQVSDLRVPGAFEPGFPVTVEATCTYPIDDLGLPGAPGSITVTSTFTSPLDPNRSVGQGG